MIIKVMEDTGSSAAIVLFELFKKVGKATGIHKTALQVPRIILHDYSQGYHFVLVFSYGY